MSLHASALPRASRRGPNASLVDELQQSSTVPFICCDDCSARNAGCWEIRRLARGSAEADTPHTLQFTAASNCIAALERKRTFRDLSLPRTPSSNAKHSENTYKRLVRSLEHVLACGAQLFLLIWEVLVEYFPAELQRDGTHRPLSTDHFAAAVRTR